jgi:plasmid stability protein
METIVFVTRLPQRAREDLRRQAFANGRTMAGEARVIIEDALGFDRRVVADKKIATPKGRR